MPVLWKIHLEFLRRHPWQSGLAVLGIALGIAVVAAVQLTVRSARASFDAAQLALAGGTSHRLEAVQGVLSEHVYAWLALTFPDLKATPVLEVTLRARDSGVWITWMGIEPLSAMSLRPGASRDALAARPTPTMETGVAPRATLRELGVTAGQPVRFDGPHGELSLVLHAATTEGRLPAGFVIGDIAWVQHATGRSGALSYIDVQIAPGTAGRRRIERVIAQLPDGVRVRDIASEQAQRRALSRAFETNLTALSLLALLVGMFLVYNTESFLVAQRLRLHARLRALGATRQEIGSAILVESACLGAIASLLGLAGGTWLASALLEMVARTVDDFYYPIDDAILSVPPASFVAIGCAGVIATALSALPAAREAFRVGPTGARGAGSLPPSHRRIPVALTSAGVLLAAGALHAFAPAGLWWHFGVLALGLLGFGLLVPPLLRGISARLARCLAGHRTWPEHIGVESVRREASRTAVAATALCLAAAVSLGMLLMTESFRSAVAQWLTELLRADAYVSVADGVPREIAERALRDLKTRLRDAPHLAAISSVMRVELDISDVLTPVAVYDLPQRARPGFRFLAGDPAEAWRRWDTEPVALATESLAFRRGLRVGDRLALPTPAGPRTFELVGIVRDYASERGTLAVGARAYLGGTTEEAVSGIGLYLAPATSLAAVRTAVATHASPEMPIVVRSSAELRAMSLAVFDRTFAITRVLGALAMGVSLIGVTGALLAQQIARAREYGMLRALGTDSLQVSRIVLAQTLTIGIIAATLALPLGIACANYLVRAINVHAFGWTMPVELAWDVIATAWGAVIGAAALAALYPAWQACRVAPAAALRFE